MKNLTVISLFLLSVVSWSQTEKGVEVSDRFSYGYENVPPINSIGALFPHSYSSINADHNDTLKIPYDSNKAILLRWQYVNEGHTTYPTINTAKWYFNDQLMPDGEYEANYRYGTNGATSVLDSAIVGFYQLRYIGYDDTTLYNTNYPVIHVFTKKTDTIIAKSSTGTRLYPNPTTGKISLKLNETLINGEMKIHNQKGEFVRSLPLREVKNDSEFDVSDLNPGIYLFTIINNENSAVEQLKVVIE
ncbi:T9SS type A sorting domain-containing protein [Brumimicrobium oceani]|uniref:Secretion system C-terminal sorting domain-containing protein n=1 Tax=Brumimicrobium oceani TaxID=2100725 RepID=A0A2U2XFX5_9FLAO|nr:T9SS type A sorting domain-containing protein [Brumimicrobium oceani]PWH86696.1 hypothetical protein DIT68_00055 [Brumimicrobium oceani]